MKNQNPKLLRYIAAGLFGFVFLSNLFSFTFNFYAIMTFVGLALIIAGLIARKNILITIGAGARFVSSLVSFISSISSLSYFFEYGDYFFAAHILVSLLYGISFGLLAFAAMKPRNTKTLGIVAGAVNFVPYLLCLIFGIYGSPFVVFLTRLITGAALLLAGMTLEERTAVACVPAFQTAPAAETSTVSDQIEKITKLKALVDSGILTQEEFDEKKKQLLGM